MVCRQGELSKYAIDSGWPHQVALPTPIPHLPYIYDWCRAERLSLCQRTMASTETTCTMPASVSRSATTQ